MHSERLRRRVNTGDGRGLLVRAGPRNAEMTSEQFTAELKQDAHALGFQLAGVCPAEPAAGMDRFRQWLAAGYAGHMRYLPRREKAYADPRYVLEGVRSILMLGMNYRTAEPRRCGPCQGRVSRYAWGPQDYHSIIHERLRELADGVLQRYPDARVRGVVDTAPLMERQYAQAAGLGWQGKNTLLLNKTYGSWFFLAALLTDLQLAYDAPATVDHCGTCRACLDACPTGAFPQPYVLDATRCISYLTIELRESIPDQYREAMGDWLFGCDICQEVCPWNQHAPSLTPSPFDPLAALNPVDLAALFELDEEGFRRRFRHSPLWRPKRTGLLRNAAVVLGNSRSPVVLPALVRGLADVEPLVRAACAWALGRYDQHEAFQALRQRQVVESDEDVQSEIRLSLANS